MAELLVSVVVSTYNRPASLARLLDSLRAQTLASDRFEVVVVDNGSGPDTARTLEDELRRGGLVLITARHELTRGPAGGRNAGWRLARAPLVAFTDDDCAPAPGWLACALA
ncbi:MAG: glycosyltransferase family 2 protein, partial [Solirubrobacteraceae bacterium]